MGGDEEYDIPPVQGDGYASFAQIRAVPEHALDELEAFARSSAAASRAQGFAAPIAKDQDIEHQLWETVGRLCGGLRLPQRGSGVARIRDRIIRGWNSVAMRGWK